MFVLAVSKNSSTVIIDKPQPPVDREEVRGPCELLGEKLHFKLPHVLADHPHACDFPGLESSIVFDDVVGVSGSEPTELVHLTRGPWLALDLSSHALFDDIDLATYGYGSGKSVFALRVSPEACDGSRWGNLHVLKRERILFPVASECA